MARNFVAASSQFVKMANASTAIANLTAYTICAFVRFTTIDRGFIYLEDNSAGTSQLAGIETRGSGLLGMIHRDDAEAIVDAQGASAYNDGNWHFIRMTRFASNDFRLFVDETQVASSTITLGTTTVNQINIGRLERNVPSFYFSGDIANVIILGHATSLEEADMIRRAGALRRNLRLYVPLYGVASPEPDLSGNGNNGTVTGAVLANHAPVGRYVPRPRKRGILVAAGGTPIDIADAGTGVESLLISVAAAIAETGTGSDIPSIAAAADLSDAGSGAEILDISAVLTVGETGAGSETVGIAAEIAVTDVGAGGETIAVQVQVPITDLGSGLDTLSVLAALGISDTGAGAETIAAGITAIEISDIAIGSDLLTVSATLTLSDAGAAVESVLVDTGLIAAIIRLTGVALAAPKLTGVALAAPKLTGVALAAPTMADVVMVV